MLKFSPTQLALLCESIQERILYYERLKLLGCQLDDPERIRYCNAILSDLHVVNVELKEQTVHLIYGEE